MLMSKWLRNKTSYDITEVNGGPKNAQISASDFGTQFAKLSQP